MLTKKKLTNIFNGGIKPSTQIFEKKIRPKKTKRDYLKPFLKNIRLRSNNIELPMYNSFNCAIVKDIKTDGYIIAFRVSDYKDEPDFLMIPDIKTSKIAVCRLNSELKYIPDTLFTLTEDYIIDPRLVWVDKKLFISVAKINTGIDYIVGSFILDYNRSNNFTDLNFFRVSPETYKSRQKNWIPFYDNKKLYFIVSINPHVICEYDLKTNKLSDEKFKSDWNPNWIYDEKFFRGNTPPIKLNDNTYLNTFHTVFFDGGYAYYDNGFYVFESNPPFKPKMITSKSSFLSGESAERWFCGWDNYPFSTNNNYKIYCTFPLGMVQVGDKVIITYGDSDSLIKYCEIAINDIENKLVSI
jgi:predicted GH43/DUF377 family glycosyl hydrolase